MICIAYAICATLVVFAILGVVAFMKFVKTIFGKNEKDKQ